MTGVFLQCNVPRTTTRGARSRALSCLPPRCGLVGQIQYMRCTSVQRLAVNLKTRIPDCWDASLNKFARSKVLPNYLGDRFCKSVATARRAEEKKFHDTISALDFEWYLRSV